MLQCWSSYKLFVIFWQRDHVHTSQAFVNRHSTQTGKCWQFWTTPRPAHTLGRIRHCLQCWSSNQKNQCLELSNEQRMIYLEAWVAEKVWTGESGVWCLCRTNKGPFDVLNRPQLNPLTGCKPKQSGWLWAAKELRHYHCHSQSYWPLLTILRMQYSSFLSFCNALSISLAIALYRIRYY